MSNQQPVILDQTTSAAAEDDIRCGYAVLLKRNGQLVFRILGEQIGPIDLLGVHEYASRRVANIVDLNQGEGVHVLQQQMKSMHSALESTAGSLGDMSTHLAAVTEAMERLIQAAGVNVDDLLTGEADPPL